MAIQIASNRISYVNVEANNQKLCQSLPETFVTLLLFPVQSNGNGGKISECSSRRNTFTIRTEKLETH